MRPIADRLLELRARHGGSPVLRDAIWLDGELTPVIGSTGLPNKTEMWRRMARKLGVEI